MKKLVDLETGREVDVPDMYVDSHLTGKRYEVRKGYVSCVGSELVSATTTEKLPVDTHYATVLLEKIEETKAEEKKTPDIELERKAIKILESVGWENCSEKSVTLDRNTHDIMFFIKEKPVTEKKEEWREVVEGKSWESDLRKNYYSCGHTQDKPFEAILLIRDLPQPRPEIRVGDEVEFVFGKKWSRWIVFEVREDGIFSFIKPGLRDTWHVESFFAKEEAKLFRNGKLIWSGE